MAINSGALWGLITIIILLFIISRIRKRKAERGWKRYDESQIYKPDEWGETGDGTGEGGCESPDGREPVACPGDSENSESGSNERQENLPIKPDSVNQPDSTGDKKPGKTGKQSRIAIPDVEPVDGE